MKTLSLTLASAVLALAAGFTTTARADTLVADVLCTKYNHNPDLFYCEATPAQVGTTYQYYWSASGGVDTPVNSSIYDPLAFAECPGAHGFVTVLVVGPDGYDSASIGVNCNEA